MCVTPGFQWMNSSLVGSDDTVWGEIIPRVRAGSERVGLGVGAFLHGDISQDWRRRSGIVYGIGCVASRVLFALSMCDEIASFFTGGIVKYSVSACSETNSPLDAVSARTEFVC